MGRRCAGSKPVTEPAPGHVSEEYFRAGGAGGRHGGQGVSYLE